MRRHRQDIPLADGQEQIGLARRGTFVEAFVTDIESMTARMWGSTLISRQAADLAIMPLRRAGAC
jgi:hypothetical protein